MIGIGKWSALLLMLTLWSCRPSNYELAPEIETTLIDGSAFRLSDLRGNYVVLDFWGSWCGPCLAEAPQLVDLHRKFGDEVVFVSIAFEKNDARWRQTSERLGFSWKHQIVEVTPLLLGSPIARAYGVADIPASFIITPDGKVLSGMDLHQIDAYLTNTVR